MKLAILILALACGSCAMSNDAVIAAVKKCRDAGMDIATAKMVDGAIYEIHCIPKEVK